MSRGTHPWTPLRAQLSRLHRAIEVNLAPFEVKREDLERRLLEVSRTPTLNLPYVTVTLAGHALHAEREAICPRCRRRLRRAP